jgi:hypothetical protein
MAKQTFTTGQVLTAAQMTSLQQTAMLGGAASAKTASYTLVAADAGTAISMSSASATTITVNTALFAAGDTVQITNLGAGVCTITAGTATVNTSASLALAQYESGTLNFTSTSAAIFIKGAGAAAAGGGMTLINSGGTTLSGASITISSIPSGYNYLTLFVENYKPATDTSQLTMRFNADSTASYKQEPGSGSNMTINNNEIYLTGEVDNGTAQGFVVSDIYNYLSTTGWRITRNNCWVNNPTTTANGNWQNTTGVYTTTGSAITSLLLKPISGNFTSGTAYLYGVK